MSKKVTKTLPSGDLYIVEVPDDEEFLATDPNPQTPMFAPSGIAGQNRCTHCGQFFNSPGILDEHIRMQHLVSSGRAYGVEVPLEDGTVVPAAALPETVTVLREENDRLKKQLAELEAKLTKAQDRKPGRPKGTKNKPKSSVS